MPVTTKPSPSRVGVNEDRSFDVAAERYVSRKILNIVTSGCRSPYGDDERRPSQQRSAKEFGRGEFESCSIITSSLYNKDGSGETGVVGNIATYENGFINGVIRAFNQDLHLVIRPDDVWQAIISQFSLFVNANSERLRHLFVEHEDKKILVVDMTPMDLADIDIGKAAQAFAQEIQKNVVDPELREWMLPSFSTTTASDKAVAAFGMMGVLQNYFEYTMMIGCGLPSVTLLGERDDWAALADRVEKLSQYGEECVSWAKLLRPVMRYMLMTFDAPDSEEVKSFWLKAAHEAGSEGSGNGIRTLSGWITAFTFFNEHGAVIKDHDDETIKQRVWREEEAKEHQRLTLDGVTFPLIRPAEIPKSVIILPIIIQDFASRVKKFTTAISGTVGMSMSADKTTAQPVPAWWLVYEFDEPMD